MGRDGDIYNFKICDVPGTVYNLFHLIPMDVLLYFHFISRNLKLTEVR